MYDDNVIADEALRLETKTGYTCISGTMTENGDEGAEVLGFPVSQEVR